MQSAVDIIIGLLDVSIVAASVLDLAAELRVYEGKLTTSRIIATNETNLAVLLVGRFAFQHIF